MCPLSAVDKYVPTQSFFRESYKSPFKDSLPFITLMVMMRAYLSTPIYDNNVLTGTTHTSSHTFIHSPEYPHLTTSSFNWAMAHICSIEREDLCEGFISIWSVFLGTPSPLLSSSSATAGGLTSSRARGSLIKLNCLINWNVLAVVLPVCSAGALHCMSEEHYKWMPGKHVPLACIVSIRVKESVHKFELHSI